MRRLAVFNHVSLDGFFTDARGDMSFAHNSRQDPEWDAFVEQNASESGTLVFGRVTYEMMAGFWPTPAAAQMMPAVADRMNAFPKIVFSRTLDKVTWKNATLVPGDAAIEMRRLKKEDGEPLTILGSGKLVASLARQGLVDDYHLVVNPVLLGAGRTMFEGIRDRQRLKLTGTRRFANGNVLLGYETM
jgi:dihydrofolate reductase